MKNIISIKTWMFTFLIFLLTFHQIHSFYEFNCQKNSYFPGSLPRSYSTNIRINYVYRQYTTEMKYAINGRDGKEFIEFKTKDRHVKYIAREDQKSALVIQYKEDEHPTCEVIKSTDRKDFLESEDIGDSNIFLKAIEVMMSLDKYHLYSVGPSSETGIKSYRYDGCLSDPKINISISFAGEDWIPSHTTSLQKGVIYPEMVIAEIGNIDMTALYSYFNPTVPDDSLFQPPADVYCKGYRTDKKPPKLPDYFKYNSETITYESAMSIAPIVSQRKVYYDYPSGISRMDLYEALSENADLYSRVTAQEKSIIHDFNAGIQYIFDPFTGNCNIDKFQAIFDAISFKVTDSEKMLKGDEYFWLNGTSTSYNGQFPVRGMTADVYTAIREDPSTKKRFVVSWYFSTEKTRIVEGENVEKNVLLQMYVRPETDMGTEGVIEVNFYNFVREEPNVYTYDLSSCFNDSSSKILVFTFPAVDSLRGLEKMIGMLIHLAIKDATGVRKQRISMKEVIFSGNYMYSECILLEESPVKGKATDEEISLDKALEKLRASVSKGEFTVSIPLQNETITLKPEPNGLNIFAGDNMRLPTKTGYKEGSVIGLTIGMLILGFLLGGVTLNLVMHRKFGVSLFQKSRVRI